jgi:hypothetical protein
MLPQDKPKQGKLASMMIAKCLAFCVLLTHQALIQSKNSATKKIRFLGALQS